MNRLSMDNSPISPSMAAYVAATLVGFGLAGIISSRATLAVPLILAALCVIVMTERRACWMQTLIGLKTDYGILMAVIILSWLPNVFFSPNPLGSLEAVLRSGLFVFLSLLLWSVITQGTQLYSHTLKSFACALTVLLGIALFAHFVLPEAYGLIRGRGWTEVHVKGMLKAAASASVLFIPLLVFWGAHQRSLWRIIAAVLVVGCLVLIWITGSRAALAGLFGCIAITGTLYVLLRVKRRAAIPSLIVIAALLAGVTFGLSKALPPRLPNNNTSINAEELILPASLIGWHRQVIWQYTWDQGADHRLFGTGANAIDELPAAKVTIGESNAYYIPRHPHNWIVEVSVETGVIGFATLVFGIVVFVYRRAREFLRTGDAAILAVLGVWAGYWTAGLFNFSFWSSWWQVCFLVVTGVCLAGRDRYMISRTSQS